MSETKIHVTMRVNQGEVTETFTGWLQSGGTNTTETKTLSVTDKPTFPDQYAKLLNIQEEGRYWYVIPKQFISDKNDFKSIDSIIRHYGGEYIPASKAGKGNQHWEILKVTQE